MSKIFEMVAPPINYIEPIGGRAVWRVCYHNAGQNRISLELVAWFDKTKELFHLLDGQVLDAASFDAYRRQYWPLPHEKERNPQNVTLGVQSAAGRQTAKT